MRLKYGELRPGKVLRVEDAYGTIKGSCLGIFAETENPDNLPPMFPNPLGQTSSTSFCQPHEGDLIWVMSFSDNPWALYYTFQNAAGHHNKEILDKNYKDAEILLRRKNESGGDAMMEYNSEDGSVVKNGKAIYQADQKGNLHMEREGDHRTVEINEDGISLGSSGKSDQPAVMGDKCEDTFKSIYKCLALIAEVCKENPYTAAIAPAIENVLPEIQSNIEQIKSEYVTLD